MPGRALACSDFVEGAPFRVHPGRGSKRESNVPGDAHEHLVARTRLRKLREEVTAGSLRIMQRQATEASRIRRRLLAPDPEARRSVFGLRRPRRWVVVAWAGATRYYPPGKHGGWPAISGEKNGRTKMRRHLDS